VLMARQKWKYTNWRVIHTDQSGLTVKTNAMLPNDISQKVACTIYSSQFKRMLSLIASNVALISSNINRETTQDRS